MSLQMNINSFILPVSSAFVVHGLGFRVQWYLTLRTSGRSSTSASLHSYRSPRSVILSSTIRQYCFQIQESEYQDPGRRLRLQGAFFTCRVFGTRIRGVGRKTWIFRVTLTQRFDLPASRGCQP